MIAVVFAAASLAPPSREALIERWLRADRSHRAALLVARHVPAASKPPNLQALARRELSVPGRYRLTAPRAPAEPVPWWKRLTRWIGERWNELWRQIAARAHVSERTATAIGYAVLALVGLALLLVLLRLFREVQRSRWARRSRPQPLEAAPDPEALYREACDCANRGDYGDAALRLFAAAVAALTGRGAVATTRSATVGDLRAALRRKRAALVPAFDAVAAPFVQTAYAERPIDASQWQLAASAFTVILGEPSLP